jgi:hypothetical protein
MLKSDLSIKKERNFSPQMIGQSLNLHPIPRYSKNYYIQDYRNTYVPITYWLRNNMDLELIVPLRLHPVM